MKKVKTIILDIGLFALIVLNLTFLTNDENQSIFSLSSLQIAHADYGESGGEGWLITSYQNSDCCTNDEGCEECTTILYIYCWVHGPYECEAGNHRSFDIYC